MDLFEPSGRGVKLTLGGRAFLERAKSILATVEAAVLAAREATNGSIGTIVIGFAPGPAYLGALSMIVAKLRERQPYVTVKLRSMTSTEQWEALRVGEIALAYSNYVPTDSSFRSVVLAHTKIGMLLPSDHRLAQKHKLRVADLAKERILMAPRRRYPQLHDDIIAAARARGVVLDLAPELLDRKAIWTLVASGLGLTFAGVRGARFLDGGGAGDGPGTSALGAAVWRPLGNLGVELRDVATWRADAARSPLLRPLIGIVGEVRKRLRTSTGPSLWLRSVETIRLYTSYR